MLAVASGAQVRRDRSTDTRRSQWRTDVGQRSAERGDTRSRGRSDRMRQDDGVVAERQGCRDILQHIITLYFNTMKSGTGVLFTHVYIRVSS